MRVNPANAACGTMVMVGFVNVTQAGMPVNEIGFGGINCEHPAGMLGNGTKLTDERP